ncbi:MAG: SRPBCC domain-containing protein [Melioribacteraceae bacterium]|nr:SRPBCC domain-containing protein [Melioribacteraceae bacterium]
MHNEIKTEILINSSSQRVYEILTNLFDYEKWNPFIIKSEGIVGVGNRIKNTMKNGNKSIVFKPKIVKADKEKEFAWLGSFGVKGIFDGYHYFQIKTIEEGKVLLVHGEIFSGILARLILNKIGNQTYHNFLMVNKALKEFAEKKG